MPHGISVLSWVSFIFCAFIIGALALDIYLSLRDRSSRKAERKYFKTLDDKSLRTSVPTDLQ